MESFIRADIFFFITTVSVIVITIFLVIALIQVSLILRSLKNTIKKIKTKYFTLSKFLESFTKE